MAVGCAPRSRIRSAADITIRSRGLTMRGVDPFTRRLCMSPYITATHGARPEVRLRRSGRPGSRNPQPVLDVVDLALNAFEVLGVDLEDQVLGPEQENRLEDEL